MSSSPAALKMVVLDQQIPRTTILDSYPWTYIAHNLKTYKFTYLLFFKYGNVSSSFFFTFSGGMLEANSTAFLNWACSALVLIFDISIEFGRHAWPLILWKSPCFNNMTFLWNSCWDFLFLVLSGCAIRAARSFPERIMHRLQSH